MTTPVTPAWSQRLLRFASEAAFLGALQACGWASLGAVPAEAASFLPDGVLRSPPVLAGPPGAQVEVPGAVLPGWYVRAVFPGEPPAVFLAAQVESIASTPVIPAEAAQAGPTPVPHMIRLLQFLAEAVEWGIIEPEEALAAACTGAVPASIDAVFAMLPPSAAFGARLAWAAMVDVERSNPLLVVVAAAKGLTEADMDTFFIQAAAR